MTVDTSLDYLTPAFYSQYNLILLGGSALFSLAAASPWPAVCGVAAELTWLGLGPRLSTFRRHIDDRRASAHRARLDAEVTQGMRSLNPEHTARLLTVSEAVSWIGNPPEGLPDDPTERGARLELEALRPAFMRLCQLRERLQQRSEELRLSPPEREVAELSRQYSAEKDLGQRFTLHQGIKAAQKRVEQQHRLADGLNEVDSKLSLVEESLSHLRRQQQQGLAGAELAREIRSTMMHVLLVPALEAEWGD